MEPCKSCCPNQYEINVLGARGDCSGHVNVTSGSPTTGNTDDQVCQLMCCKIHHHIFTKAPLAMGYSQSMNECGRYGKEGPFLDDTELSDDCHWLEDL